MEGFADILDPLPLADVFPDYEADSKWICRILSKPFNDACLGALRAPRLTPQCG
jgi:hypothetical protein